MWLVFKINEFISMDKLENQKLISKKIRTMLKKCREGDEEKRIRICGFSLCGPFGCVP